jgi:hypothetical protein
VATVIAAVAVAATATVVRGAKAADAAATVTVVPAAKAVVIGARAVTVRVVATTTALRPSSPPRS